MKKMLLVALMLTVFAVAGAHAQVSYDAAVSYSQPTGDFSDSFKPGFGIGADLFYSLSMLPNIGVGGRLAWNRFDADDNILGVDGGNMSIVEILPSVRYSLTPAGSQFGLFGQIGLGLYHWSSTVETVVGDIDNNGNDFGFSLGAGATGKFSDTMSFMLMPMYHIISTEDTNTTYFNLSFGIMF